MRDTGPILVTGSHRSGTTWLGRVLAKAPRVYYVHEPFSVSDPPSRGVCNTKFHHWFTYVSSENEDEYYEPFKKLIECKYDWQGGWRDIESGRDIRQVIGDLLAVFRQRLKRARPLLKDPIALFSAEWLAKRFDAQVVILVRHPAAFISSLMKLGWEHPFGDFLAQHRLINEQLQSFENDIRVYAQERKPVFDQGILLWRIIYGQVIRYRRNHPEWIVLRHEDLSRDPYGKFQELFSRLNLVFTERVRSAIHDFSGPGNPVDSTAPVGSEKTLRRDSKNNLWNWKTRLTGSEIAAIRRRVEDISGVFYSNEA